VRGRQPKVSNDNITQISIDELARIQDLTDWEKVKAMTDEEIEINSSEDPDCQPTNESFWDDAKVVKPNRSNGVVG
jgi:hypothetical protein